jgi:DNA topoisomerase-1
MLPPLEVGQVLGMKEILSRQTFTRNPPRYSEASLVKKLEEMGIGRPSTYAPTISTVQKRNYIEKETREGKERVYRQLVLKDGSINTSDQTEITGTEKSKLFPTNLAMVVNDFLLDHFPNVVDYGFTANVEKEFDEIARGQRIWNKMIGDFYNNFHERVESTAQVDRASVQTSREVGTDPKTGKKVIARLGKFGPIVQIGGDEEDEEKPQYASLRHGQFIENITLEDALELFKLPREVGKYEEEEVIAAIGRFGPYLRHKGKFYSLGKEDDPLNVPIDRAIEIIDTKRKQDEQKTIKLFDEDETMQVLNGRYGPYIKAGKKNVKIPKDKKPEELTYEECKELADKAPEKKGRFSRKKK